MTFTLNSPYNLYVGSTMDFHKKCNIVTYGVIVAIEDQDLSKSKCGPTWWATQGSGNSILIHFLFLDKIYF